VGQGLWFAPLGPVRGWLDLARTIASPWNEAHALAGGHRARAPDYLREALVIFQRIGAAEADDVSAELAACTAEI
jgi:hypothetical protein